MVRSAVYHDATFIAPIYNFYITETHTTFETEPISPEEIKQRMQRIQPNYPYLVYEKDNEVVGYAYATRWKERKAYDQTAELSVYVNPHHRGKNIGRTLYTTLISQMKERGYQTLLGGIALPNEASIRLHESLGFEKTAELKAVGFKHNRWINVGYWQIHFNAQE